ncbi:DEAD/DEAH box helicase [Pseudoalteromonas sp. SSM20]|uniref:DEAD/DEAH box helicase n=1 Tax=Pseudoalteromonas sp. SSM20 TaxID=3139394 RepID=UPI003BABC56A
MLTNLLSHFSEDELLSFLPQSAIKFAIRYSQDDENEKGYNLKKLAAIVANTKQSEFIFNASLREKLISRLSSNDFIALFPEFNLSASQVKASHFDAAISWANVNIEKFAEKVGLSELFAQNNATHNVLESISYIEPNYSLYPYQQDISQQVLKSLEEKNKRVLIHLPTGAGKTRTAMNIACEHLRKSPKNVVLWLADREELCTQAFDEFNKAWRSLGNRPTSAYGFYSNSNESLSGIDSGFVVAGLHKFLRLRKSESKQLNILYKKLREVVTLVIFDEAHKSIAPEFQQVVDDFIEHDEFNADLIGLTATPGRQFGVNRQTEEDKQLADFYFNNKISMRLSGYLSPIDYLVENEFLAKANFKSLNYDHSNIAAYELVDAGGTETLKALANNFERNQRILNTVKAECDKGSQIIVFACNVEHGINIATALAYMGIKAASVDSKFDTSDSRRAKIAQYKAGELQVLVNFNVLTAGFDAPKTNVTVIAKPMNSLVQYLQMAGRAMRGFKSGGNKECTIYTVMDDIPEFQSINLAFDYWNGMWADEEQESE